MLAQVAAGLTVWEIAWWAHRRRQRSVLYTRAATAARSLGRPLVVVGAPDRGTTSGYGCGDFSVDISDSSCPRHVIADVTKRLPFADDSVVVFVSCVLEYVSDLDAALAELRRVSGGWLYVVRVEPWTVTAHLYPGAKRSLPKNLEPVLGGHPAAVFLPTPP